MQASRIPSHSANRRTLLSVLAAVGIAMGSLILTAATAPAFASPTLTATAAGSVLIPAAASPVSPSGTNSPFTMVMTPNSRYLYVADESQHTINVLDSTSDTFVDSIALPNTATSIESSAISPNGSVAYFADYGTHMVYPVTTATNVVGTPFSVGAGPLSLAVSPNGSLLYTIVAGNLLSYDLPSGTLDQTIPLGLSGATSVVISPDGKTAWVADGGSAAAVTPINLTTEVIGTPITVGSDPYDLAMSPDGSTVYVVSAGSDTIQAISTTTDTASGPADTSDATGNSVVRVSPDGNYVYVVGSGGNLVVYTADLSTEVVVPDPGSKYGMVASPDGKRLYTTNLSGSVAIFNIATLTVTGPASITPGTADVSFTVSLNDGNTPVGDYSSYLVATELINSSNTVVGNVFGSFDATTGKATITIPTSSLPIGTYSVLAATGNPSTHATISATADGFLIRPTLATTGVDGTVPLAVGGILTLAGMLTLVLTRAAARRSRRLA